VIGIVDTLNGQNGVLAQSPVEEVFRQGADKEIILHVWVMVRNAKDHSWRPDLAMSNAVLDVPSLLMAQASLMHHTLQSMKQSVKHVSAGQIIISSAVQRIQLMEVGLLGANGVNVTRHAMEVTGQEQDLAIILNHNVAVLPVLVMTMILSPATLKHVNNNVVQMSNSMSCTVSQPATASVLMLKIAQPR